MAEASSPANRSNGLITRSAPKAVRLISETCTDRTRAITGSRGESSRTATVMPILMSSSSVSAITPRQKEEPSPARSSTAGTLASATAIAGSVRNSSSISSCRRASSGSITTTR